MNITLKWDGKTGDGKSAFIVAEQNDGWRDVRLELDTDDVDSDFARQAMQEIIDRVNAGNEIGAATLHWSHNDAVPDRPGLWAYKSPQDGSVYYQPVSQEGANHPKRWERGEWCLIGPVPQIYYPRV
jgi:hypothetical protein